MSWSDPETSFDEVKSAVAEFVKQRHWDRFHSPRHLAAAIAIEAAELQEIFLWKSDEVPATMLEAIRDEVADVLIYLCSFANRLGVDLSSAVEAKLERNAIRYPPEAEDPGAPWPSQRTTL